MELEKFKYEARRQIMVMIKLLIETAADESIKKETYIQHKLVSTALALLIEAETLEKELTNRCSNISSENSISE